MSAYSVDGTASVRVEIEVGSVRVIARAREDVAVDVSPSNPNRGGDRAAAEAVRVDQTGGEIVVRGPHKPRIFGAGKDSVELVVEVPEASDVAAVVKFGSARLAGRFGAVRAEVPFGELSVDSAERLELKGGHGDYRVTHVAGDADLRFKSGMMRVGHVGGRLQLTGADGPITVDRVDGPAEVKTSSGSLEIGTTAANATIRAAYGGIHVREAIRGVVRIDGSYGSVDVGVRSGTAVWLDATSQHGVVRTDLAADSGPGSGEDTLELHIRTGYGSIDVHRSEGS
ncbi:DUF4097 domain-containing protein [Solirubrobacter phytolaccae]|uniref:DUF4097 domain-containing protein n=1 Tax=Solirubrobacter phytolaccae TaxID=1404360 RepID=A0A9X3N7J0_9ACTN|nr:DUF4097 family beta strand repeat-containing protein [Solirubrobacter phytolaccae]MDA0179799.1 DUF4097 domain-containing protein [Solirubrobacter phytolaccae]